MKPKLVLNIVQLPPSSLAIQVAEQDEEFRREENRASPVICEGDSNRIGVRSSVCPEIQMDVLFIRGRWVAHDHYWATANFDSAEERAEWLRKLQNSLDHINGSGEPESAASLDIEVKK